MNENRLKWTDMNWATYLGCSVQQVQEYKKILNEYFIPLIKRDNKTKKYSFEMYRYDATSAGRKKSHLEIRDPRPFNNMAEAIDNANSLISCMELKESWANTFNMPKRAIQMMLVREK
jgi:hypothetical protein